MIQENKNSYVIQNTNNIIIFKNGLYEKIPLMKNLENMMENMKLLIEYILAHFRIDQGVFVHLHYTIDKISKITDINGVFVIRIHNNLTR